MLSDAQQTSGGPFDRFSLDFALERTSPWSPNTPSLKPSHGSHPRAISHAAPEPPVPGDAKDAHEAYYQPLYWAVEQELDDNYIGFSGTPAESSLVDGQNISLSTLWTHPSLGSITSADIADTSVHGYMPDDPVLACYPSNVHTGSDMDDHPHPQPSLPVSGVSTQPADDVKATASSYISPSLLDPFASHDSARTSRNTTPRRSARQSPYPSTSPEPHHPGSQLTTFKRRNVQVSRSPTGSPPSSPPAAQKNPWKCPFCSHIQHNRRSPDFKRHIETHTPPEESPRWVCCGVPVERARALGLPTRVIREEGMEFAGMLMVGGCRKTFSRKDALSRHLRKTAGECYGDALATYQPGNMGTVASDVN